MIAVEWGTITELLAAVAGFAAVVWAILSNKAERRESAKNIATEQTLTRKALAADAWERARWQAKIVTCAVVQHNEGGPGKLPSMMFEVFNDSPTTIYRVHAFANADGKVYYADERKMIRRDKTANSYVEVPKLAPEHECGITFQDSSGAFWARYADGCLNEIDTGQPMGYQLLHDRDDE